jgi:hypothetical protein
LKPCAATILPEPPGSVGMAINHSVEVLPCLSAEPTARSARRPRSAEDESPLVVGSIAILAVIVFSCVGMLAPILWDAFTGGRGRIGARGAVDRGPAPRMRRHARSAPLCRPSSRGQRRKSTRLFLTYEIGSGSLSNSYAFVSKLLTSGFSKEGLKCSR